MFPQIFGKYVLEREIAAGGMARVYLATLRGAVGFEKRLVLKQIRAELASDEAFVNRFVEEAKTAVELSHPNIVPVYELGVERGVYYIAMELCAGLTLSELLAETGPLTPAEGAHIGVEICRALDYAHRRAHIVHRDVTPRNVLIDDEGGVRLIDFGIAAPASALGPGKRREVFGSPGHMPPEQLRGEELSPATDVFAVGALLIEAWTGSPPFRRPTLAASEKALFEPLPRIESQVPALEPLGSLIESSVALDAARRPVAAEQLGRGLREFLRGEDSGDLARRLGARVHEARQRARGANPWASTSEALENADMTRPLNRASSAEPSLLAPPSASTTRTFAAREEVEVWTRKLSSVQPPEGTPDSELQPTPVPTLPSGPKLEVPRRRWPVAGLLSALAVLLLISAVSWLTSRAPRERISRAPVAVVPVTSAASPRVQLSAPESSGAPLAAPVLARAALSVKVERARAELAFGSHAPAPSTNSAEAEQFGELKITADPRAQVTVNGAHFQTAGQSPLLGLRLPVGKYRVGFKNETYGVPLNAEVVVVPGVSRSVHADFRQAEPAISVH